jgi:hypothetical protein
MLGGMAVALTSPAGRGTLVVPGKDRRMSRATANRHVVHSALHHIVLTTAKPEAMVDLQNLAFELPPGSSPSKIREKRNDHDYRRTQPPGLLDPGSGPPES